MLALRIGIVLLLLAAAALARAESTRTLNTTLPGGALVTPQPEQPTLRLSLLPRPTQIVATVQRAPLPPVGSGPGCAPEQTAAPYSLGRLADFDGLADRESRRRSELAEDPIPRRNQQQLRDPTGSLRLRVGGRRQADRLELSARIERAPGKGSVAELFLQGPDCSRRQAEELRALDAWRGARPLRAGAALPASTRGDPGPVWYRLGFGAPLGSVRAVTAVFRLEDPELRALLVGELELVVRVTQERDARLESVGLPIAVSVQNDGSLFFAAR